MRKSVLLWYLFFSTACFTFAATTKPETDLVVKDRIFPPKFLVDSFRIIPEQSITFPLPKPLPPLLNECAVCGEGDRQWYYNVNSLKRAAYVCGFDYLLMRFDRSYKQGAFEAIASFFFHTVNDTDCRLDSVSWMVSFPDKKEVRTYQYQSPYSEGSATIPAAAVLPRLGAEQQMQRLDSLCVLSTGFRSRIVKESFSSPLRLECVLRGKSFSVDDKEIFAGHAPVSTTYETPSNVGFMLATFGSAPLSASALQNSHPIAPEITSVRFSYPFSQCAMDIWLKSPYGLREMAVTGGKCDRTFPFQGEKNMHVSSILPLTVADSAIVVEATDIYGNQTQVKYPVYKEGRQYAKDQQYQGKIHDARKQWAKENAWNSTLNFLSEFNFSLGTLGLGPILGEYCKNKAIEKYLKTPDFYNTSILPKIALPSTGRMLYVTRGDTTMVVYPASFYCSASSHAYSEYSFAGISLTPASSTDRRAEAKVCLPYGPGNYVPTTAQSLSTRGPGGRFAPDSSCFFVCKSSGCDHNRVSIQGFPAILDKPSEKFEFSIVMVYANPSSDTMVLTYVLHYLDRSKDVAFRQLAINGGETGAELIQASQADVRSTVRRCETESNGSCLLTKEIVEGKDKLFRVDVLFYSTNRRQTVAAGSVWAGL